jgi:hypothetical protein
MQEKVKRFGLFKSLLSEDILCLCSVLWLTEDDKELTKHIPSFDTVHYSKPSNPVVTPSDKYNCISTITAVHHTLKTDTVSTTMASYKR